MKINRLKGKLDAALEAYNNLKSEKEDQKEDYKK